MADQRSEPGVEARKKGKKPEGKKKEKGEAPTLLKKVCGVM